MGTVDILILAMVLLFFFIFGIVIHTQYVGLKRDEFQSGKSFMEKIIKEYSSEYEIDIYADHVTIGKKIKNRPEIHISTKSWSD